MESWNIIGQPAETFSVNCGGTPDRIQATAMSNPYSAIGRGLASLHQMLLLAFI